MFMWLHPSLGSTLPGCVRLGATEKLRLTGGSVLKYAQKRFKTHFSCDIVAVERPGDLGETTRRYFWVGGAVERPIKTQKASEMVGPPHNSG